MAGDWIKLYRKSLESGLMQNANLWTFWCWCLLKASHQPRNQMVGMQMVNLQPGQFVFGRKAAAAELNMSERTIRTCVQKLKTFKNLTIKSTNKFSIISITNWVAYQAKEACDDQQDDQQPTSKRPAGDHKQESKNAFIPPLPPTGESDKPSDFRSTAEKVYKAYIKTVSPSRKSRKRAVKNICTWISRGRTESDLVSAISAYAKVMSEDPAYRKDPANFFGINEDFCFDYLPCNQEDEPVNGSKQPELEELLK